MRRDYLHINQHEKRYKGHVPGHTISNKRDTLARTWSDSPFPLDWPSLPPLLLLLLLGMRNEVKRKWDQCLCRLPTPLKGLVNRDEGGRGNVAHLWLLSKELWQTSVVLRRGNGNEVEHCCAAPTRIRSWSCCKQLERGLVPFVDNARNSCASAFLYALSTC